MLLPTMRFEISGEEIWFSFFSFFKSKPFVPIKFDLYRPIIALFEYDNLCF